MNRVLAGQQPFAEQNLDPLETTALVEVLVVRDEHVPDDGGVAGDEEMTKVRAQCCGISRRLEENAGMRADLVDPGLQEG